jgi:hypothetical protein
VTINPILEWKDGHREQLPPAEFHPTIRVRRPTVDLTAHLRDEMFLKQIGVATLADELLPIKEDVRRFEFVGTDGQYCLYREA